MKIRKKVNKKQIIGKTLSSLMVAAMILPSATALTTYAAEDNYKIIINEIESNDPNGVNDWIELANPTGEELDVSGIVIKDNDDTHEYIISEGTKIPANGFLLINDLPFGLGKGDSVRLYENTRLIAETTWTDHTNPSWGLYPDVNGCEYRSTKEETPGAANRFPDIPDVINWPGSDEVIIFDTEPMFFEDSSGLDFHNGRLCHS